MTDGASCSLLSSTLHSLSLPLSIPGPERPGVDSGVHCVSEMFINESELLLDD